MKLTPKQERFVSEYLIDLNATQAAIRAGYSPKAARQVGCENLTKPDIASAVEAGRAKVIAKAEMTGDEWRKLVSDIARGESENRDRLRALELMGKHLGLLRDRMELTGKDGGPIETKRVEFVDV